MRKIIFVFCLILLVSCSTTMYKCRVNYSVVYPDTTIIYDTVFTYNCDNASKSIPYASSYKGTNYIKLGYYEFSRTTCPIRINSYEIISINE